MEDIWCDHLRCIQLHLLGRDDVPSSSDEDGRLWEHLMKNEVIVVFGLAWVLVLSLIPSSSCIRSWRPP